MKAQALLGGWVFLKYLKRFPPLRVSQFEDRQNRGWAHNYCIMVSWFLALDLLSQSICRGPTVGRKSLQVLCIMLSGTWDEEESLHLGIPSSLLPTHGPHPWLSAYHRICLTLFPHSPSEGLLGHVWWSLKLLRTVFLHKNQRNAPWDDILRS